VAWIKADTKAILAIHEHVITNNARLSVTHSDYNTWTLNIRGAHREDRGIYMCQINTDPMKSQVRDDLIRIPVTRTSRRQRPMIHLARWRLMRVIFGTVLAIIS
jgi:hypothetical protein